jgi:hypothetical protein
MQRFGSDEKKENFMQAISSKLKFTLNRLITSHAAKTGHPAFHNEVRQVQVQVTYFAEICSTSKTYLLQINFHTSILSPR